MTSGLEEKLAKLFGGTTPTQVMQTKSLRGLNLSGIDLGPGSEPFTHREQTDFSGWDLREVNMEGMDLRMACFAGSDLRGANLKNCHFGGRIGEPATGTVFQGADLRGACLDGATGGGRFSGADCRKASFRGVRMGENPDEKLAFQTDFSDADLREAVLDGGDFQVCRFDGADMRGGSFQNCNFRSAALRQVDAMNADFRGANLTNIWLDDNRVPHWRSQDVAHSWAGAKLDGANLSNINPDDWNFFRLAAGLEWTPQSKSPWVTSIPFIGPRLRFLWQETIQTKAWSGACSNATS